MSSGEKTAAGGAGGNSGGLRILLVDDRRSALMAMKFRFARLGIETAVYDEESAALQAFAEQPEGFDAIVASLAMQGLRGDAFAQRAWSISPDVPITLLSGLPIQERLEASPTETDVCIVAQDAALSEILLSLESQGLRVPRAVRQAGAA